MGLSVFKNSYHNYPYIKNDIVMDTILEQQVWGKQGSRVAKKVISKIKHLEKLWNRFDPDSFINKLNRLAGIHSIKADMDTIAIIKTAQRISSQTDNAFDITVLPLLKIWQKAKKEGTPPELERLKSMLTIINSSSIQIINDNEVFLPLKGQAIDLGGIAKGYAVDIAHEIYLDYDINHAIINFGGNVLVIGTKPDGSSYKVGLQKPGSLRGECFGFVEVTDCSVVTSGNYERNYTISGESYSHIITPNTGWTVTGDIISATVIAYSSTEADALATAAIVMGKDKTKAFFEKIKNCQVIILDKNNQVDIMGKSITNFVQI